MDIDQKNLREKILAGKRIDKEDALSLFDWDLTELGLVADARRRMAVPGKQVGYIIDRIINYTNICEAACRFCAFHARGNQIAPYEMTMDEILSKVTELVDMGGIQVMLQGGLHPDYTMDTYLNMVSSIKEKFPNIYLHSFSPAEIIFLSKKTGMEPVEIVSLLKQAGLDSVPGASDILVDEIRRKVSPNKISTKQWCEVIFALAENNMKSSATMTYGMGETLAQRVQHLEVVRDIQDKTSCLRAFIPWSFSPANTRMEHIIPATGVDYLKIIAISRIFLDNIKNFQAGWLTEGLKLAQVALAMGANDMGGVLTEEVVVKATGIKTTLNAEKAKTLIINAGKIPFLRDSDYQPISGN